MASKVAVPAPKLLTAAGGVHFQHEVLGLVISIVAREEQSGCGGGGLPISQAIFAATDELQQHAATLGGNGVIDIKYMHRISNSPGCFNTTKQNIEVYAWGTAIRF